MAAPSVTRTLTIALAILATLATNTHARIAQTPEPQPIPAALARARAACPATTTIVECRGRLREAYQALQWTQKARRDDARRAKGYGVDHALRLASALYGVPLAQMRSVGACESHLHAGSKNSSSSAAGVFQFLDSTWARAGVPGFSVYDPYANVLAAARLVRLDGSWREWSCAP